MITTSAVPAPLLRPRVAAAQRPLNATLPTPWVPVSPQWSIRDSAAHLITGTALYTELVRGMPSPLDDVSPEAFDRFSAARIADIADVEPAVLAKSLADAVGQFLTSIGNSPSDTLVQWHGGVRQRPLDPSSSDAGHQRPWSATQDME